MQVIPKKNQEYVDQTYWDARFQEEDEYEWLIDYSAFRPQLTTLLENKALHYKQLKYLIIGCGNSTLGNDMTKDGFTHVVSIDFSPVVIDKMRAKYPEQTYIEMDIRNMTFSQESFDVVIDKAVLDTLQADTKDKWDVNEETKKRVQDCLDEVLRVLAHDGIFLMLSFDQPHFRQPLLQRMRYQWISTYSLIEHGRAFPYFLYQAQKTPLQKWQAHVQAEQERQEKEKQERQEYLQYQQADESEDEEGVILGGLFQ